MLVANAAIMKRYLLNMGRRKKLAAEFALPLLAATPS